MKFLKLRKWEDNKKDRFGRMGRGAEKTLMLCKLCSAATKTSLN